jgi:hypothetical protein
LPDLVDPFVPRLCTAGTFFFFPRTCMKLSLSSVLLVQGLAKVLLGLGQPAMVSVISTQMVSMGKDRHRLLHLDGKAIHSIRASATRNFPSQYRENFWGNITDILSNGPNPFQDYLPPRSSNTTPYYTIFPGDQNQTASQRGETRPRADEDTPIILSGHAIFDKSDRCMHAKITLQTV